MKRSILNFHRNITNEYHAVFTNNHGRKIYLSLSIDNNTCNIHKCYYLDRSSYSVPKRAVTQSCKLGELLEVINNELDKNFISINYSDTLISRNHLIEKELGKLKYNILILLKEGNVLRTIFKNKFRRSVFLEITLGVGKSLISKCYYCDKRGEDKQFTPYGLKTIYFESGIDSILSVVNCELEGGFTDVVISENNTIILDRPICGSI